MANNNFSQNLLIKFFNFFLFSNLFIALCATAATFQTFLSVGEITPMYLVFIFCSTFVFYNGQRIFLSKKYNKKNSSERHEWILKNKRLLILLCLLALIISIPLICYWTIQSIILFGAFSIIAMFYFIPQINLRSMLGIKAAYISLLWVFSTLIFPLLLQKQNENSFLIFKNRYLIELALERFFFIFPLCIVFNIRDMEMDKESGIKTLPIRYGIKTTKIISILLMLIFLSLVLLRNYYLNLDLESTEKVKGFVSSLIISAIITIIVLLFSDKKRREYYYLFIVDGMILVQAGLVILQAYFKQ